MSPATNEDRRLEGSMFTRKGKELRERYKHFAPGTTSGTKKVVQRNGRPVIVPNHRSVYSPKPGEPVGRPGKKAKKNV